VGRVTGWAKVGCPHGYFRPSMALGGVLAITPFVGRASFAGPASAVRPRASSQ